MAGHRDRHGVSACERGNDCGALDKQSADHNTHKMQPAQINDCRRRQPQPQPMPTPAREPGFADQGDPIYVVALFLHITSAWARLMNRVDASMPAFGASSADVVGFRGSASSSILPRPRSRK